VKVVPLVLTLFYLTVPQLPFRNSLDPGQAAGPFEPQNQWVAYAPAFHIKPTFKATAHVDKAATRSQCTPIRTTP
jgi:hypothetical protein